MIGMFLFVSFQILMAMNAWVQRLCLPGKQVSLVWESRAHGESYRLMLIVRRSC